MFEFLCVLAGAELALERIERIANWNLSTLDWSEVLRLAEIPWSSSARGA